MEPAPTPEPYREPRTGFVALRRKRAWRAIGVAAAVLALVAAAEVSVVRQESSPRCRSCDSRFSAVNWRLHVPFTGIATELVTTRSEQYASPAAELAGTAHSHRLRSDGWTYRRGLLLAKSVGFAITCGRSPSENRFASELNRSAEFAAHVRDAVHRGDARREDIAAAIDVDLDDIELHFGERRAPTAEERRVRDVANALYAAWQAIPAAEADLWGERAER